MNILRQFYILAFSSLVIGCSNNSGHSTLEDKNEVHLENDDIDQTIVELQTKINTAEIKANRNFDFRIDQSITFWVYPPEDSKGTVHIYSKLDAVTDNGDFIANPMSRITSFQPIDTNEITININNVWENLYFEWIPTNAQGLEQVIRVNLGEENYTVKFY